MKAQIKISVIIAMILSLTACADMTTQNLGESFQELSEQPVPEPISEESAAITAKEVSESLFEKEDSFILKDTGARISLADCNREYSSENFRIYSKYVECISGTAIYATVIYLQTPDKSMQLFPNDYVIDKENGDIYVLYADEENTFISMYVYGAGISAEGIEIQGTKVMSTYMVEDWLLDSHGLEVDELRECFSNKQVKLGDLAHEQGDVILKGEASGIYKMTGEKYYIDWEWNAVSGEEKVTPCILRVYDKEKDKEVFQACENAFDLIEQGDLSVVVPFNDIKYFEQGENWKWQRVDVNGDGLPELIRSDVYRADSIPPPITYIFTYVGGTKQPVEAVFSDLNDFSEYFFIGADETLIYNYSDHGEIQYGWYPQYQYDEKWNRKLLGSLQIYYFEKGDYYAEMTDWYKENHPDTYGKNGGGYYFFQNRPKTMEELKDNEDDTYWVREEITKDAFLKAYRQMAGGDFFTQNPDFLRQ